MSEADRLHTIAKRQLTMLRRSTAQWYFSVAQCTKILEAIPAAAHVDAIVTMFSRITDIENLDVGKLLGHRTFDSDGNGWITEDELAELNSETTTQIETQRYLQVCHRIGHANLFNPLFPEREYALNLRDWAEVAPSESHPHGDKKGHQDQRRVAECLIVLSAEPGDNTVNETYNGNPVEVESRWDAGIPHQGMFCTTYNTRRGGASPFFARSRPLCSLRLSRSVSPCLSICRLHSQSTSVTHSLTLRCSPGASLALRLPLCRALLAPGRGRYKQTLALCPLNARALESIGDDEKLQKRYRYVLRTMYMQYIRSCSMLMDLFQSPTYMYYTVFTEQVRGKLQGSSRRAHFADRRCRKGSKIREGLAEGTVAAGHEPSAAQCARHRPRSRRGAHGEDSVVLEERDLR